ncbi:conserved hypothetical protein [Ricinus communis]|uniref:PRP1 splicing factor N-terminal domain-containing protein n=1 Tax=Ricinus communis TaxID=3988 RepID=B9SVV2_RICCO|nr:conserved hypothetical protein [Ricinus communis]
MGLARAASDFPDRSAVAIGAANGATATGMARGWWKGGEFDRNEKDYMRIKNLKYDEDDKQADAFWKAVDEGMESKKEM